MKKNIILFAFLIIIIGISVNAYSERKLLFEGTDINKIPSVWKKFYLPYRDYGLEMSEVYSYTDKDHKELKEWGRIYYNITDKFVYRLLSPYYIYSVSRSPGGLEQMEHKGQTQFDINVFKFLTENDAKNAYKMMVTDLVDAWKKGFEYMSHSDSRYFTMPENATGFGIHCTGDSYNENTHEWFIFVKGKYLVTIIGGGWAGNVIRAESDLTNETIFQYAMMYYKMLNDIKELPDNQQIMERKTLLDVSVNPDEIPADGKSVSNIKVVFKDSEGKPIPDAVVQLERPGKSASGKTRENGSVNIKFTAPDYKTMKNFEKESKLRIPFKVTVTDPITNKKKIKEFNIFIIKPLSLLRVFFYDENDLPLSNMGVKISYNKKINNKIRKVSENIFSDEKGWARKELPDGTKVDVVFLKKEENYLNYSENVTVPCDVRILCTTIKDYTDKFKKDIADFLVKGGYSESDVQKILRTKFNYGSDNNSYDPKTKSINISSNVSSVKDLDNFEKTLTHEFGHYIIDNFVDPSSYFVFFTTYPLKGKYVGGGHEDSFTPSFIENMGIGRQEQSFEEGSSEFFSQVFLRSRGKTYDKRFDSAEASQEASKKYMQRGDVIEGNIASFLMDYYKDKMDDPQAVIKDFNDTLKEYDNFRFTKAPARTIEEFIYTKLNSDKPGIKYNGNIKDLADKYCIGPDEMWTPKLSNPEAMKNIKMGSKNAKGEIEWIPAGDWDYLYTKDKFFIDVPQGVNFSFQRLEDGYFTNGKMEWVNLGPGRHEIKMEKGYNWVEIDGGRAQFINAEAKGPDGEFTVKPKGTNFLIEVDENKNSKVTTLCGSVIVKKSDNSASETVTANMEISIAAGKPLENPKPAVLSNDIWWMIPSLTQNTQEEHEENKPVDTGKIISFKNGELSMWLPDGFKSDESSKNCYIEIFLKDNYGIIQVHKINNNDKLTLTELVDGWNSDHVGQGKTYFKKLDSREEIINDLPLYIGIYDMKANDNAILRSEILFTVKGDQIYVFNFIADISIFDKMRIEFERIIKSIDLH